MDGTSFRVMSGKRFAIVVGNLALSLTSKVNRFVHCEIAVSRRAGQGKLVGN